MKSTRPFLLKLVYVPILIILLMFIMIGVLISINVTVDSRTIQRTIGELNTEELFVHFLNLKIIISTLNLKTPY